MKLAVVQHQRDARATAPSCRPARSSQEYVGTRPTFRQHKPPNADTAKPPEADSLHPPGSLGREGSSVSVAHRGDRCHSPGSSDFRQNNEKVVSPSQPYPQFGCKEPHAPSSAYQPSRSPSPSLCGPHQLCPLHPSRTRWLSAQEWLLLQRGGLIRRAPHMRAIILGESGKGGRTP